MGNHHTFTRLLGELKIKYVKYCGRHCQQPSKAILPTPILLTNRTPVLFKDSDLRKVGSVPWFGGRYDPGLANEM